MVFTPSIRQNLFEFKVKGSRKTFSIPLRQFMPMKHARELRSAGMELLPYLDQETGQLKDEPPVELLQKLEELQTTILEKYCPGLEDVATEDEVQQIWNEWGRLSSVTMGE